MIFSYAGSGLLRSTDGGDTWSLNKGPGNDFSGSAFAKFVFHPTDPNVIYAVIDASLTRYETTGQSGVYRTINGGGTWEKITVNTGAMTNPASTRGTTSLRTGSVPSARSALI